MSGLLTVGNAAKLYCLERIDALAGARETVTLVDLGCGTGANFVELLRRRPNVRYVGVEPSAELCAAARRTLDGLAAEIVNEPAYDVRVGPADVVVSFSVLEHVYRRDAYVRCIAANLAPDGTALVNYDAGHFVAGGRRDRAKTLAGGVAARLGRERWYQRFVPEAEFRRLAASAGLQVVEARSFNTPLKEAYRAVPEERREEFMREWLRAELVLGELVDYRDELAGVFRTRNFVLAPQAEESARR